MRKIHCAGTIEKPLRTFQIHGAGEQRRSSRCCIVCTVGGCGFSLSLLARAFVFHILYVAVAVLRLTIIYPVMNHVNATFCAMFLLFAHTNRSCLFMFRASPTCPSILTDDKLFFLAPLPSESGDRQGQRYDY